MDLFTALTSAICFLFFLKRAFFGPQKKFAFVFLLLTGLGLAGLWLFGTKGLFSYVSGGLLLIAPLVGVCMVFTSLAHHLKSDS